MADSTDQWSDSLRTLTRTVLENYEFVPREDGLHFKQIRGGFGTILINDLMSGTLRIVERGSGREFLFQNAEDLIRAGWAID